MLGDNIHIVDAALTGIELVEYIYAEYHARGLKLPYIPDHLVASVQMIDSEYFFATADHVPLPLDFIPGWLQAGASPNHEAAPLLSRDYLFFGASGYGVNSYFFHYYLHCGGVYLFYKYPFGGVYIDREQAAARINEDLAGIALIMERVAGAPPQQEHPVVIIADARSNEYGRGVMKAGELAGWQEASLGRIARQYAG